jgi:hypothetical protein
MRLPAAVALVCLLVGGAARAREHHHHEHHQHHEHREHKGDARHHLEKANALAGEGKCAAAVKEFTAAYDKLQDPVVLFNRAECYRRLGENAKAADDYRGFLKGFPTAPNRAEIEARIAALEKPAPPKPPVGTTPPVPPKPPVGTTPPVPPKPPVATTPLAPPKPPVATTPGPPKPPVGTTPGPTAPPVPPPKTPPTVAQGPVSPNETMPFLPPPPPEGGDGKALIEAPHAPPAEAPRAEASHGSHWLLWTTLAVVVVGGGVAAYWFLRPKDEPLPATTLGHFQF